LDEKRGNTKGASIQPQKKKKTEEKREQREVVKGKKQDPQIQSKELKT